MSEGGYDVSTRLGLSHHLPDEHFDGFIVEDVARFINKAVLSVRRIGVERHDHTSRQAGDMLLSEP